MADRCCCAGAVVWSEHSTGLVRRLLNGSVEALHRLPPPIYDLKLVDQAREEGNVSSALALP